MVHPQKRIFIKKTLECTICRICELKRELVATNPRESSIYVHLDQLLFDLKYDPSIIEIPVPRYFREDDRIYPDFDFKEKLEREAGGKKKKKAKKKKKKKKKDDDDEEKKPDPRPLPVKNQLITQLAQDVAIDYDTPVTEIVQDPFTLDIDIVQAIRIIQKNDRGRQGRHRISLILQQLQQTIQKAETLRLIREGKITQENNDNKEAESCTFIQQRMRGILARKYVERLRSEEMEFLGMQRKKKTLEEERNDPIKKMEEQRLQRKRE